MRDQEPKQAGPPASDSPFGINTHIPDDALLDLVQRAGIRWVRLDFNWNEIEPKKGQFHFDRLQRVVASARQRGLDILATLAYSPAWANGGRAGACPPTNAQDWKSFVSRTVATFRREINHWGMWNEPNLRKFWDGNVDQYVDLILKPGCEAARSTDPASKIVAPDVCIVDKEWPDWILQIGKRAGAACLDVFSCHIYKEKASEGPDAVVQALEKGDWAWVPFFQALRPWHKAVRAVLAEAGLASKAIWLNEVGWHTRPGYEKNAVSDKEQAAFYKSMCQKVAERKTWLQRAFFYELRDLPGAADHKWGVLRPNNEQKPAYAAYQKAIGELQSSASA